MASVGDHGILLPQGCFLTVVVPYSRSNFERLIVLAWAYMAWKIVTTCALGMREFEVHIQKDALSFIV